MTKAELDNLEDGMTALVVRLELLGGFDANAGSIQTTARAVLSIIHHIAKRTPEQIEQKMLEVRERLRNQR